MLTSAITAIQTTIVTLNQWFTTALGGNALVAGAITASILASIFYMARRVPVRIFRFIKRHTLYTYSMEYSYSSSDDDSRSVKTGIGLVCEQIESILQRRLGHKRSGSRIVVRNSRIGESIADGIMLYRHKNIWMLIQRKNEQAAQAGSSSSDNFFPSTKSVHISLTTLRWFRHSVFDFIKTAVPDLGTPGAFSLDSEWNVTATRLRALTRPPVIALEESIRKEIDEAMDNYMRYREENTLNGIPHKLAFLFYGEPGTGKSTIAEYIATRLKTSLFVIKPGGGRHGGTPAGLREFVALARNNIPQNEIPVVLADDFDTLWKNIGPRKNKEAQAVESEPKEKEAGVPLANLLMSLQSPIAVNDCIIIFTTNHLEKIDPAVYRPGRIDHLISVGRMKEHDVMRYYETVYKSAWPAGKKVLASLRACDVAALYTNHSRNPHAFVEAVTRPFLAPRDIVAIEDLSELQEV